jgi:hypothetical protein
MAGVGFMVGAGNVLFATTVRSVWRPPSASYQMDSRSIIIHKRPKRADDSTPACNIQLIARALRVMLHILKAWCCKKPDNLFIHFKWGSRLVHGLSHWPIKSTPHGWPSIIPLRRIFRYSGTKRHYLQEMPFQETGCTCEQNWRRIRF